MAEFLHGATYYTKIYYANGENDTAHCRIDRPLLLIRLTFMLTAVLISISPLLGGAVHQKQIKNHDANHDMASP